jgi:hypothetical protein
LYLPKFAQANQDKQLQLAEIQGLILSYLHSKKQQGLKIKHNNIYWYNSELINFKIDLAREIIQKSQYVNWDQQSDQVLILLNFATATLAAQNALLKFIEEPPANTLIILPVLSDHRLLSTIKSRCLTCHLLAKNSADNSSQQSPKDTTLSWPQDLPAVFALIKQYKDREAAKSFIKKLLMQETHSVKQKQALARAYLDLENNLNVRLVLEHCFFSFFQ